VTFETNSLALSADARASLDKFAVDLIANPATKATLKAYSAGGGGPETRRLSLARGLAVRAYLIDKGVPRDRLDVQALGASADGGPADRVDVVGSAGT
jgi:outer membrane protein OmpA-like peptidoglycan-associated protein